MTRWKLRTWTHHGAHLGRLATAVCWCVASALFATPLSTAGAVAPLAAPAIKHTLLTDWQIQIDMTKSGFDYTTRRHRLYDERAHFQYDDKRGSGLTFSNAYVSDSARVVNGCTNGAIKGTDTGIDAGVIGGPFAIDPAGAPPEGWLMESGAFFNGPPTLDPALHWTTLRPSSPVTFPVVQTTYTCGVSSSKFVDHLLLGFPIFLPGTQAKLASEPIGTIHSIGYDKFIVSFPTSGTDANKVIHERVVVSAKKVR